jgi:hypothetical protein
MPKAVLLAFTGPKSQAVEDEYNQWYDSVHLRDVLAVEGVRSATRFKLAADQMFDDDAPGEYLAIYEIEADDLAAVGRAMQDAHRRGDMPVSRALRLGPSLFYELVTERVDATDPGDSSRPAV